jgi:WD40 repeat protein
MIVIWKWEQEFAKEKLFEYTCPQVMNDPESNKNLQISFFLFMNYRFCVISNRFIYFYEITKKAILEVEKFSDKSLGDIVSHSWFYEGNLVVATETHIVIFNDICKVIQKIMTFCDNSQITVICPVVDALIAAGTNGRIEIYEKKLDSYEKNPKSLRIYENEKEKSFDFMHIVNPNNSFAESIIFATTTRNDLISISLRDLDKFNEKNHIKYLISAFHFDSVEGLDVCINKPYLISCSKDKSIKLWDLQSKTLAINKFFEEGEMYSIAYHPSGMHAVVSFVDKIKPIHISYEEILPMINGINAKKSKEVKIIR